MKVVKAIEENGGVVVDIVKILSSFLTSQLHRAKMQLLKLETKAFCNFAKRLFS